MKIYRDNNTILKSLVSKKGIIKAILDTDTYNEIDDQFALVQMLFSKKRIKVHTVIRLNSQKFMLHVLSGYFATVAGPSLLRPTSLSPTAQWWWWRLPRRQVLLRR